MIRRRFLGLVTLAGASGITALTKAAHSKGHRVTAQYKVTGFTCITCATGLETLLSRERGVLAVKASYPEGRATVSYNPQVTNEVGITSAIQEMGFKAQSISEAKG